MLTEALTAAAAAGGVAVAQAAGTDSWAWFRTRCARLLGRGDSRREGEALDQLDRTAAVLDAAADDDERRRVRDAHARLWQGEFASLLESLGQEEQERIISELDALAREFGSGGGPSGGVLSGNTFNGPVALQTGDRGRQENHFGSTG
jgi:hypothetical protein